MLNFTLTPDQLSLQKNVREFALKEILPRAWFYDETNELPSHIINKASELGLLRGDMPKEYGGLGHSAVDGAIVTEEVAAACAGLATSIYINSLGYKPLVLCNNDALKQKYLPKISKENKKIWFVGFLVNVCHTIHSTTYWISRNNRNSLATYY